MENRSKFVCYLQYMYSIHPGYLHYIVLYGILLKKAPDNKGRTDCIIFKDSYFLMNRKEGMEVKGKMI